jgi:16S rRNA (guanine527-N7)-methyltransferase
VEPRCAYNGGISTRKEGAMDEKALQAIIAEMGIVTTETQAWELLFHLDAMLRANQQINLTSITDREEGVRLHILDSLTCVDVVQAGPAGRLLDIRSGAGYPGIPLAIITERPVTLVEARSKKAGFLGDVAKALDHKIDVRACRAEDLEPEAHGAFAVVVARALAPLPSLVELAAPLLVEGGRFVALKGRPDPEEVERGDRAAVIVGLSPAERVAVAIPGTDTERSLFVFTKQGAPSVDLPRRTGVAQKRPLS